MASVTFLGTGGGRYVMLSQARYSGGIWLDLGPQMILDPGPGALVRALEFGKDPSALDAVFVSHRHLDHYNDAEVMIEAMTEGGKTRKGSLVCPENMLEYVSDYHKASTNVVAPRPFDEFVIGGVKVRALPTKDHVDGLGYSFTTREGVVVYAADTDFSERLTREYRGATVLILNVIFPAETEIHPHLNTDKAVEAVKIAQPDVCVITHFGTQMISADPNRQAAIIERKTGVRTIAAQDGQTLDVGDTAKK